MAEELGVVYRALHEAGRTAATSPPLNPNVLKSSAAVAEQAAAIRDRLAVHRETVKSGTSAGGLTDALVQATYRLSHAGS